MDVKAMAKSKRSHTKHHQPRKPHRPNTQPSPSSSNDPKVSNKDGDKTKPNPGSSLPSNWDRYYDSDDEDELFRPDSDSATKSDVVKPKSKGADFGFLLSEAMSQSAANFSSTFDDVLPDFSEGLGSMLSVRGENLLSWTGNDKFLMEDEEATSQEVPFLSLNLQALSEDLAKIDLAQRLFIEDGILPPELRAPRKAEKESPKLASASSDNLVCQYSSKLENRRDSKEECSRTPLSFWQKGELDDSIVQKAGMENKTPRFEARAAETDLDTLLDSFDETKSFPSAGIAQKTSVASDDSVCLDPDKSWPSPSNLDNDIDDLLQETSVGFAISDSGEVNGDSIGKQGTKSKVMEDFDSWLDTI